MYTHLPIDSKILNLAPLAPQVWGGTRFQSPHGRLKCRRKPPTSRPPELGDLGGKNLRDETQETYVYTVARGGWSQHNHLEEGRGQEAAGRRGDFRGSGGERQKALPDSNISSDRPLQFAPPASSNNRLLDLERELRAKKQQFEQGRGQEAAGRREYFLGTAPEPQKRSRKRRPKTPLLSFKAYVFDTGDPIVVEYPGDRKANHLPSSHLPQLTSQSEPELVTSLSYNSKGKGDRIDEGVSTHQNGHRATNEAIEPELNFQETSTASPHRDNSHNNGFHATFGNIGDEMKHATYFDLGEVEIESPFDEFDREMDREQSLAKAQTAPTFEARFDEFDRDLNLGESSSKTNIPPPRERGEAQTWKHGDAGTRGGSDRERKLNPSSPPLTNASTVYTHLASNSQMLQLPCLDPHPSAFGTSLRKGGWGEPEVQSPLAPQFCYGVHTSPDRLQNTESSPPSPFSRIPLRLTPTRGRSPSLGGTRFQSPHGRLKCRRKPPTSRPPELGDLGGKNLRDETQETYVYTVAQFWGEIGSASLFYRWDLGGEKDLYIHRSPKASGDKTDTAIKAIAEAEGSVEVLPYGSLVWPGTSPTLWPVDFDLVVSLQLMDRGVVRLLPAIACFLLYTLAFLIGHKLRKSEKSQEKKQTV